MLSSIQRSTTSRSANHGSNCSSHPYPHLVAVATASPRLWAGSPRKLDPPAVAPIHGFHRILGVALVLILHCGAEWRGRGGGGGPRPPGRSGGRRWWAVRLRRLATWVLVVKDEGEWVRG